MCIEFRAFLGVSCSYQGSDKLISQALTSAGLPTGPQSDKSWPHLLFLSVSGWKRSQGQRRLHRLSPRVTVVAKSSTQPLDVGNKPTLTLLMGECSDWAHSQSWVNVFVLMRPCRGKQRLSCFKLDSRWRWEDTASSQHLSASEPTKRFGAWLQWALWPYCLELGRPDEGESTKISKTSLENSPWLISLRAPTTSSLQRISSPATAPLPDPAGISGWQFWARYWQYNRAVIIGPIHFSGIILTEAEPFLFLVSFFHQCLHKVCIVSPPPKAEGLCTLHMCFNVRLKVLLFLFCTAARAQDLKWQRPRECLTHRQLSAFNRAGLRPNIEPSAPWHVDMFY